MDLIPVEPNGANDGTTSPAQPAPVDATPKTFPMNNDMPNFPTFSATTAELLARARLNAVQNATQAGGYEAAREQLRKSMVMSDNIPLPSPGVSAKRGRGRGRAKNGDARSTTDSTPSISTPVSERGRGKPGRPRGRGRGGGRGGKRKRSESVDSEGWNDPTSDSDADGNKGSDSEHSASYTPLPKVTKSGRSVNKPTQYVPVIPEPQPQSNKKKRPYRRNVEAAVCKMCYRGTSPSNNQIVFCDGCGTPYHQYCHDPPIEEEVVQIQEKEWFCAECVKSRESNETANAEGLVSGESLTIDEKRARLSNLTNERLMDLILRASSIQPSLSLFPAKTSHQSSEFLPVTSTLPIINIAPTAPILPITIDPPDADAEIEPYDGYDTDPPAHYPKPGNGLARTLPPEHEDLEWLVDEDEEVFSHQVKVNGGKDITMDGT